MLKTVVDSTTLITCCQAALRGVPVIERVLDVCALYVPKAVYREVVAVKAKYPDARLADRLITDGRIEVESAKLPSGNVLENYRLGLGERECIALYLEKSAERDFLVTDDQLAYIVSQRCGIPTCLFLDLIIELVERKLWQRDLGEQVVRATRRRFSGGFVPHTLTILQKGDRRCLT